MNEPEIIEKSMSMHALSEEISIHSRADLDDVVGILKGVKQHRKKISDYWKTVKIAANKAYQEIRKKE